jgi:tetratricopeptide (TPR) repeat protein
MESGLEAAVLDALSRADAGHRVTERWLRRAHPRWWRQVRDLLEVHRGLRSTGPERSRVGAYRLLQVLGEGATGTVHLAEAIEARPGIEPGARVALKVIHSRLVGRRGFLERALREARVGAEVRHPNVVPALDVGVAEGKESPVLFVAHELVEGQNLRALLYESRRVPEDLCRHVAGEVLRALAAIHGAGFVHRDLKPENVMLARDGRVRVTDLGAAQALDGTEAVTVAGEFVGTLPYAAPEQILRRGPWDGRVDLYSLGVVLHELLEGEHPFLGRIGAGRSVPEASRRRAGHAHRLAEAPPIAAPVSEFLRGFVATLMAHEPAERFRSAREALEALERGEDLPFRAGGGDRTGTTAFRVPDGAPPFVGRDAEIAGLLDGAAEAAAGSGGAFLVEGETGAGKSRLLEEFAARASRGHRPHLVWVRHGPDGEDPGGVDPCVVAVGAALRRSLCAGEGILGSFERRFRKGEAGDRSRAGVATTTAALAALSRSAPVVVLADDLDDATSRSARHFASWVRRLRHRRVLLVATARCGGALPKGLRGGKGFRRMFLGRLEPREEARLLAGMLGSEAEADRVGGQFRARTGGLPGLTVVFVEGLRGSGTLVRSPDGSWSAEGDLREVELPDSFRETVERRAARLGESDRDLLGWAASIGLAFDPALVAEAAGRTPLEVLRGFARIESRTGLVRSREGRRFFESRAVREALGPARPEEIARKRHAALAAALERRAEAPSSPGRAALDVFHHAIRGGDAVRAARWLPRALTEIPAHLHAAAAAELLREALDLPGAVPPEGRVDILLERARLLGVAGRSADRSSVLAEAKDAAIGSPAATARVLAETALALVEAGELQRAEEVAKSAAQRAREARSPGARERALCALGRARTGLNRTAEAAACHRRQVRLARALGDPRREAMAEEDLGAALDQACEVEASIAHFRRALDILRGLPDSPVDAGRIRSRLAHALALSAREPEAIPLLEEQIRAARRAGDVGAQVSAEVLLADLLATGGRSREGLRISYRIAREVSRCGDPHLEEMVLRRHGRLLVHTGKAGEGLEQVRASRAIGERLGSETGIRHALCTESLAWWTVGGLEEAEDAADAALGIAMRMEQEKARFLAFLARARCGGKGGGNPGLYREALAAAGRARDARAVAQALLESGLARTARGDPGGAAELEEALGLGRAQRSAVASLAAARLAAEGLIAADAALEEYARSGAGLSVAAGLEAEFDLWRATSDRAHADAAVRRLEVLREGAPRGFRDRVHLVNDVRRAVAALAEGLFGIESPER